MFTATRKGYLTQENYVMPIVVAVSLNSAAYREDPSKPLQATETFKNNKTSNV